MADSTGPAALDLRREFETDSDEVQVGWVVPDLGEYAVESMAPAPSATRLAVSTVSNTG